MAHDHSKDNIFYNTNNQEHSRMEMDLRSDEYLQSSMSQKGASLENSLYRLQDEDSLASTYIMMAVASMGGGYLDFVANLDQRSYNSAEEKAMIDKAPKF